MTPFWARNKEEWQWWTCCNEYIGLAGDGCELKWSCCKKKSDKKHCIEKRWSCCNGFYGISGCKQRFKPARYSCCGENNDGCKVGWKCCNNGSQTAPGCKSITVAKINDSIYETNNTSKRVYLPGNKTVHIRKFK